MHLHLKLTGLKKPSTFLANHLIHMYGSCGDCVGARKVFDTMSNRNLYSWNNMLSGYAKMGMMKPARKLFDKMPERDVISWNTMVIGYAQTGQRDLAVKFFKELRRSSIGYNDFTFGGMLLVCVKATDFKLTQQVHGQVLLAGLSSNVVLASSAVDAYAKSGEIDEARRLFDEMQVKDVLAWTTLVSGYAKYGDMQLARELFDRMPERTPVTWTSLIAGYARNGMGYNALELFSEMMMLRVRPDQFTFSSCLCACASISSLKIGKQLHACMFRANFKPNMIVMSSLIDMYAKCGRLSDARQVFYFISDKQDPILWNTMISSLAQHGLGEDAVRMFNDMLNLGVKPNRVTLVVILSACSHSGLVQEGLKLFTSITNDHGIVPDQEHYACLIDLLGRAGCFDQLMNHLDMMPCGLDNQVLNSLLGVCRIHENAELGGKVAEKLLEMKSQSPAAYVLLSRNFATLGKWELVEEVRRLMNERGVRKEQALSWVETEGKVYTFTASDRSHPLKDAIYANLDQLTALIEEDATSLDTEW